MWRWTSAKKAKEAAAHQKQEDENRAKARRPSRQECAELNAIISERLNSRRDKISSDGNVSSEDEGSMGRRRPSVDNPALDKPVRRRSMSHEVRDMIQRC
jgi:hypothetical protein